VAVPDEDLVRLLHVLIDERGVGREQPLVVELVLEEARLEAVEPWIDQDGLVAEGDLPAVVPNHLKLTPAAPGPPPAGAGSAPSATPGKTSARPRPAAAAAPATRLPPRNPRLDIPFVSMKHMGHTPR